MLDGLPVDLILSISDFLSTEDTACLSLCSRRLYAILLAPGKIKLPTGTKKYVLLSRLEQDLPARFLCSNCQLLHKYDASQDLTPYAEFWRTTPPHCTRECSASALSNFSLWTGLDKVMYRLYVYHVQLVMKRLFHGAKYGLSIDELAHVEVKPWRGDGIEFAKTSLSSFDAQICREPPSVLLRTQEVLYGPCITSNGSMSSEWIIADRKRIHYICHFARTFDVCPHVWIQKPFERTSEWVICMSVSTIIKRARSNFHCQACGIDFLIQHVQPVQYKTDQALIITKWVDLGAGSSPDDPRWAKHAGGRKTKSGAVYGRSSPRIRFETTSPMPLAALESRNLYYLRNRRYEQIMHHSALKNAWYLAGQEVKERLTESLEEQRAYIIPKSRRRA